MRTGRFFGVFAALAAVVAAPVAAQESPAIQLSGDVKVVKTITSVGTSEGPTPKTELVDPSVVVPGDRLVFRTNYTNVSDATVENFVITNPLNKAVMLAPGEAANIDVSIDGGTVFGALSDLKVADSEGAERSAQEADVTHLRWTLTKVDAGESGQIKFYVIVR